jgi:hypothetical protein
LLFVGLSLILAGLQALCSGRLHYQNYWGGSVFAPFAIALGLAVLIMLVIKWRTLNDTGPRLRGKAARRARKAATTRSLDDFDKPWNP